MENGTLNSRLLILESRILQLEKTVDRLSKNMHYLDGNDESFLQMIKTLTSAVECNERVDETIHELVQNRIKGLYMRNGKLRKQIDRLRREMKIFGR